MRIRAKEGTCWAKLVELAIPICQRAEQQCPKRSAGRKPEFADWQVAVLILIVVAKGKKTKSAQYRYLKEHQHQICQLLSLARLPARSTYFDRYRRAHSLLSTAILVQGEMAVRYGWANAEVVAADKSLIAARGPVWHRSKGRNRRRRPGVDREAAWGRNEHDGWVYGYGYEVVVSCGKNKVLWPLLVSTDKASVSESMSFREKIPQLPKSTRYVLADRGYDADDHCEAIEWTAENQRTGRRFLCPTIERYNARRPRQHAWKESRQRKRRRAHRDARKAFLRSHRGKSLYARRGKTVEPFNSWFKALFELEDRVWHKGRENNQTQLSAAIFIYQLLLRMNRAQHQYHGQIKWILDSW